MLTDFHFRYIEIFKSSLSEANGHGGMRGGGGIRPLMSGGMPPRPGPYDRGDRFGMGMNMMGMGYGRGRGRNVKGKLFISTLSYFGSHVLQFVSSVSLKILLLLHVYYELVKFTID